MKVFISYSVEDIEVVRQMARGVRDHGDEVRFWDESKEPGEPVWPTINKWIDTSDAVIAVITDNAIRRSTAIGKEIGIAETKAKKILPLVAQSVDKSQLDFLGDRIWVDFDQKAPGEAMRVITGQLAKLAKQKVINALGFAIATLVLLYICRE